MPDAEREIHEMIERETRAWDTQDVELLLSLFHPDMVWPWPPHPQAHDPIEWVWGMGRFDHHRWRKVYEELFRTHRLVHNHRLTRRVEVSPEADGAFAVVDIDTLWRAPDGTDFHWRGRVCKIYTRVSDGWKFIAQTGALEYPPAGGSE